MANRRKRFIAGATCPNCNEQDTLVLFVEGDDEQVECVHCHTHFTEPQASQSDARTPAEKPLASKDIIGLFKPAD